MRCDSGINNTEQYVWAEPDVYLNQKVRRIGVVIPAGSEMTVEKLKQTAVDIALESSCRVIIEWRAEKRTIN